jgi:ABC-2 type transport system ATP-binding protein
MPRTVALQLRDIRATYGSITAVDGLTLHVHRGEIVALLGPNGSGKSTTLGIAAGILDPVSGSVEIEGIDRASEPLRYATRVGFVPQDSAIYEEFTAVQNLEFFGRLHGLRGYELDSRIAKALARSRLIDRSHVRAGTFSGGLRRRLGIAVALLPDPPVLLLDEPTAALDSASRDELFAELHRLRDDGHAILLTTHHADEAEQGCDRIAVLENGRLVADGSPSELMRTRTAGRSVLFGHLHETLPKFVERRIRQRLDVGVGFEVTGHRVRLSAWTAKDLGRALALVLGEGACLDQFRSAPGRLEPTAKAA